MKILIDDAMTGKGKKSGIGYFAINLFKHLKRIVDCDFSDYPVLGKVPTYFKKWAYIGISNIPYLTRKYDIVHHITHYSPWITGHTLHIMTVHDLSELKFPETIPLVWRHYNAFSLKKSVQRADALITHSKAIQNEVIENFPGLDKSHVFMCYPGTRSSIPNIEELSRLGLTPYTFFFYVGVLHKRKNLPFLLDCFIKAKEELRIDKNTKMLLVGTPAWGYDKIKPFIVKEMGIIEMGYLNDVQVATLFRYCKAFIYASIYEGFGHPIIEAMTQGAPILISNIPTSIELNENHNNQMFTFQLNDTASCVQQLERIDKDWENIREGLSYGDLTRYGYENVAKEHLKIYNLVIKNAS